MKHFAIIRYTLLTAARDWLYMGIMLLVIGTIGLSIFLGGTALAEQGRASIIFMAGSVRFIVILGLVLFVCFHVRRAIENKEIELILTRPISRQVFVLSYYLGFAVLSLTIIIPLAIAIITLALFWSFPDIDAEQAKYIAFNVLPWSFNFFLETLIIIAFAMFSTLILESAVFSTMVTLTFYCLSRLIGFFLISTQNPTSIVKSTTLGRMSEQLLGIISVCLPRLDMFTRSEWLVYGISNYNQYLLFSSSALIFVAFILLMTVFDFLRKQF